MPRRWLLGLLVLTCWAGSMAWRVRRDCLPLWKEEVRASYRSVLYGRLPWRERFRFVVQGAKVGTLDSEARWEADGTIGLRHRLALAEGLPGLGAWMNGPVSVNLLLILSKRYLLQSFTLDGTLGDLPVRGSGTMGPKGMDSHLRLDRPGKGNSYALVLPLDPSRPLLLGSMSIGGILPDVPVAGNGTWKASTPSPSVPSPCGPAWPRERRSSSMAMPGRPAASRSAVPACPCSGS